MRVLFTLPAYPPFVGGAQTFVRAMAQRLVADGCTVTVLTTNARRADDFWRPSAERSLPREEVQNGVRVVRVAIGHPPPAPYLVGVMRRAGHWLQRCKLPEVLQKPILRQFARFMPPLVELESRLQHLVAQADLVHAVDASWDGLFTAAFRVAQRCRRPFVATPLIHTGSSAILAAFTMAHQRDVYRQAAVVTALSRAEQRLLMAQGVARSRTVVLPMGIDPGVAAVPPGAVAHFRRRYALQGPVVAFVGAATYDKGAPHLARAMAILQRRGIDAWLVCAGPQQDRLVAGLAGDWGRTWTLLGERMRLLGVVDETTKHTLLAASTLLALPSRVDSFGIVLLEAAVHGKPVVAAAAGGLVETVVPGETGLLTPFGDVERLANALAELLQNPRKARRMGLAGRKRVLARYTWNHTYEQLRDLYAEASQSLLHRRSIAVHPAGAQATGAQRRPRCG